MHKSLFLVILASMMMYAQTYTDMLGRQVEVTASSKLVFIGPGALRMGVYLGLDERLVGIEKTENDASTLSPYRTFLGKERIEKLPIIGVGGPGKMPDLEALIVQKPDLIIASFLDKNQLDMLSAKTGIPVLALSYGASYGGSAQQLQSIKNSLLLLGNVTHTLSKAENVVAFMNETEKKLTALAVPSKKVYVGGLGYKGSQGITSTEANYPPFELLGLKNALFDKTEAIGHHFIDLEALINASPELIFIDRFGKEKVAQEYERHKVLFDTLHAYKTGQIKEVSSYNFYATNIENLFLIAYHIASYMGATVDVEMEEQQIYKAFYGEKRAERMQKLLNGSSL